MASWGAQEWLTLITGIITAVVGGAVLIINTIQNGKLKRLQIQLTTAATERQTTAQDVKDIKESVAGPANLSDGR